jgi:hypothetical protein
VVLHLADRDRLHLLGNKSGQSFIDRHAQISDALATKADGCGQNEVGAVRLEQISRTDVGSEPGRDQSDDVHEGLCRLASVNRQMFNFFPRQHFRDFGCAHSLVHSLC